MSVSLRTNIAALGALGRLDRSTRDLSSNFDRLSSGLRITKPSDDAAGLAIGSSLKTDARVYAQGIRNISDGVSVLNVAEGALGQLSSIMIRQRELAEQAANGVHSGKQRLALQAESNALTKEYNRILRSATFGGNTILDGTGDSFTVQQGYGSVESTLLSIGQSLGFAAGAVTFNLQTPIAGWGVQPSLATGDLNGDGFDDVVALSDSLIALGGASGVVVLYGQASGGLSGPNFINNGPTGVGSDEVTLVDLNGDGNLDISYIRNDGSGMEIRLGNGNGTFLVAQSYAAPSGGILGRTEFKDINGDGALDAVIADSFTNQLVVYLGNSNGSFKAPTTIPTTLGDSVLDVGIGDLNGDGIQDLILTETFGTQFYAGNGDGTFRAKQNIDSSFPNFAGPIRIADINNDGFNDVLTASGKVILGNGDGTFRVPQTYQQATGAGIQDMNGDGILDTVSFGGISMFVRLGNADGSFNARLSMPITGASLMSGVIGDFNGDGTPDAAFFDGNNGLRTFLANGDSTGRRNNFIQGIDLLTTPGARDALRFTRTVLNRINSELGKIGALQSRLSTASAVINTRKVNYDSAAGQILDADMAVEAATLAKQRILQQAAASVLAQANQQPALALRLLGRGS